MIMKDSACHSARILHDHEREGQGQAAASAPTGSRYTRAMRVTHWYTASSLAASGPGRKCGLDTPRCTDSQAAQSSRLVTSQKSTAYEVSLTPGGNSHVHSMLVRPGPIGSSRCVIT